MKTAIILLASIAFAIFLPIWLTGKPVPLREIGLTKIGQLLGILFVIALFLERALDVFLTTLRAQKSEELDHQIRQLVQDISGLRDEDSRRVKKNQLDEQVLESAKYRSNTRLIALWSGLIFGILISAVGIRTLQTFVEEQVLSDLPKFQKYLFHTLDVLLTGGLIAGGSDGVHKLVDLYRNFMETSVAKLKRTSNGEH